VNDGKSNSQHEHDVSTEEDAPPIGRIALMLVGLAVVILLVVVGLRQVFTSIVSAERQEKILGRENRELAEQRATDERRLTTYEQLDAKKGVYQIPIERAMKLLLARPQLLRAPVASSAPTATPTSAPAPAPASKPAAGAAG